MKKKLICAFTTFLLLHPHCFSFELDTSIDDEINRNYNASELEHKLPKLPNNLEPNTNTHKQKNKPPSKTKVSTNTTTKKKLTSDSFTTTKINNGTKFQSVSKNWASDSATTGNRITFTTTKSVTKRYITIPAGSTIKGRIVDTHQPQFSGNGGLIKIEIESITIDGGTHYTKGIITKANNKNIFFNNIKGKRKYLTNIGTNIKKSHKFFQKAMKKTSQYANDGLTVIISPFTFVGGTIGWIGGTILSPITAIPAKGARISLPPETSYTNLLLV